MSCIYLLKYHETGGESDGLIGHKMATAGVTGTEEVVAHF